MPVDPKVYELALHFLEGDPAESVVLELAERIQAAAEEWSEARDIEIMRKVHEKRPSAPELLEALDDLRMEAELMAGQLGNNAPWDGVLSIEKARAVIAKYAPRANAKAQQPAPTAEKSHNEKESDEWAERGGL